LWEFLIWELCVSFVLRKEIKSLNGQDGRGQFVDGKSGEDIIVQVPLGTIIHNLDTGEDKEILKTGEKVLIAKGGKEGREISFFVLQEILLLLSFKKECREKSLIYVWN